MTFVRIYKEISNKRYLTDLRCTHFRVILIACAAHIKRQNDNNPKIVSESK